MVPNTLPAQTLSMPNVIPSPDKIQNGIQNEEIQYSESMFLTGVPQECFNFLENALKGITNTGITANKLDALVTECNQITLNKNVVVTADNVSFFLHMIKSMLKFSNF